MNIIQDAIEFNNILTDLQTGKDINGAKLSIEQVAEYIDRIYLSLEDVNIDATLKATIEATLLDVATLDTIYNETLDNTFDEIVNLPSATEAELLYKENYSLFALRTIEKISKPLDPNDAAKAQLIIKINSYKQDLENEIATMLNALLQELSIAHAAKDNDAKSDLLSKHAVLFIHAIDTPALAQNIDAELVTAIKAFDKIESAKEGSTVTVDSVEEAREIANQGGIVNVANAVSLKDSKTVSNVIHQNDVKANNVIVRRGWC